MRWRSERNMITTLGWLALHGCSGESQHVKPWILHDALTMIEMICTTIQIRGDACTMTAVYDDVHVRCNNRQRPSVRWTVRTICSRRSIVRSWPHCVDEWRLCRTDTWLCDCATNVFPVGGALMPRYIIFCTDSSTASLRRYKKLSWCWQQARRV